MSDVSRRRLVLRAGALALCVTAAACAQRPRADVDYATSGDPQKVFATARGIVHVVGSEPQTSIVLTTADGAPPVALTGEAAEPLRGIAGVEIDVAGERVSGPASPAVMPGTMVLAVQHFTVTAVDGVAAHDGTLEYDAGSYHLRLRSGERLAAPALPPSLRQHIGARIYLSGPLDRAPAAYGIIVPRPH